MDSAVVAGAALGLLVLGALWVSGLRRDTRRRAGRAAEWTADDGDAAELWTSAARCLSCGASGAILSREDGQLWHTCMACGRRHTREHQA